MFKLITISILSALSFSIFAMKTDVQQTLSDNEVSEIIHEFITSDIEKNRRIAELNKIAFTLEQKARTENNPEQKVQLLSKAIHNYEALVLLGEAMYSSELEKLYLMLAEISGNGRGSEYQLQAQEWRMVAALHGDRDAQIKLADTYNFLANKEQSIAKKLGFLKMAKKWALKAGITLQSQAVDIQSEPSGLLNMEHQEERPRKKAKDNKAYSE